MKDELAKTQKFHQIKDKVPSIVKKFIKKDHIMYGGRAIDSQVLPGFRTQSKDFDIYSKTPKEDALKLEKELDRIAGADIFTTEKAKFPKTTKVKDFRGETVADFTEIPKKIKTKILVGTNVETLTSMKPTIQKSIRMPKNAYRREKDRDNLNRIKLMEKLKKSI